MLRDDPNIVSEVFICGSYDVKKERKVHRKRVSLVLCKYIW